MEMMKRSVTLVFCALSVTAGLALAQVSQEPVEASAFYSPPEYEPTGIITAFNYGTSVLELDGENFYVMPNTWIWVREEEGEARRLNSPAELMNLPLIGKRVHYMIPDAESRELTHLLIILWVPGEGS